MTAPARPLLVTSRKVRFSVVPPAVVVITIARVLTLGGPVILSFVWIKNVTFKVTAEPIHIADVFAREEDDAGLITESLR